jgi:hydrogenase maturation protein HypF
MNLPLVRQALPVAAPARVLACGAWLKNTACLLDGDTVWMSPLHGDLGTPQARAALLASVARLQQQASGPIEAVAHDLHPDFFSTEVAQQVAQTLGVPAIAVQHHHAHIAQVQAQRAPGEALLGWALDGMGLGTDQTAWGGELLLVQDGNFQRLDHLPTLRLPGGDVAAREPWRMAAAALHRMGLNAGAPLHTGTVSAETWFGPVASSHLRAGTRAPVPTASLKGIHNMLARGLNCPPTTSAGRWFDAVAGLLGVCWWQTEEAQAATALEQLAAQWLSDNSAPMLDAELIEAGLNLDVLLHRLLAWMAGLSGHATRHAAPSDLGPATPPSDAVYLAAQSAAAALFHVALADALARAAIHAAQQHQIRAIALSGGCFYNRILRTRMVDMLTQAGLTVHLPIDGAFGDAGLALGQAWVAAHVLHSAPSAAHNTHAAATATATATATRNLLCV